MKLAEDYAHRHPSTVNLCKWLDPNPNLPSWLQNVATIFQEAADEMLQMVEKDSPEVTAGLRKLLEAKDCFVRAAVDEQPVSYTDR